MRRITQGKLWRDLLQVMEILVQNSQANLAKADEPFWLRAVYMTFETAGVTRGQWPYGSASKQGNEIWSEGTVLIGYYDYHLMTNIGNSDYFPDSRFKMPFLNAELLPSDFVLSANDYCAAAVLPCFDYCSAAMFWWDADRQEDVGPQRDRHRSAIQKIGSMMMREENSKGDKVVTLTENPRFPSVASHIA